MSNDRLPNEPGYYHWDEWNKTVKVYSKGNSLWTRVYDHWQPIKITPRIAGRFTKTDKPSENV